MRRKVPKAVSTIFIILFLFSYTTAWAAAPITSGLLVSVDATSSSVSGTTWSAADSTSYAGTLQSSSMYTSPNNYVTLGDSTNQYINFGNIGSTAGSISGETWIYINTMHVSGWNIVASKWFNGTTEDWHFGYYLGALRICYRAVCPTAALSPNSTAAGAWHHVAFTIKQPVSGLCSSTETGGVVTLYMDSVQVAQDTGAGACHPTSSTEHFVIGDKRAISDVGLDGRVSKFRFYTRELSSSEITQIYNAEKSIFGIVSAPTNSSIPTFSGISKVGSSQTGTNGSWNNSPTSYTYKWYRSATVNGTYTAISGATNSTYTTVSADYNQYLKFEVTATNAGGSAVALSTATLINAGDPVLAISGVPLTATYRTVTNLTMSPGFAGRVQFLSNGKRIGNCVNVETNVANSFTATCAWLPTAIGFARVQALFTPSGLGVNSGASAYYTIYVKKRSTLR